MKGVDLALYANTGTDVSPTWTFVGGQRGATLHEAVDTIDVSAKKADGTAHREYEYGFDSWTVSADGVYISTDAGYAALVTAMRNKAMIKVRMKDSVAYIIEGLALVTSRDLEGPYEAEATYSMELQGTGALTLNPV